MRVCFRVRLRSWLFLVPGLVGVILLGVSSAGAPQEEIDFNRARQLYQRSQKGEKLTDAERTYVERAKAEFARGRPRRSSRSRRRVRNPST